MTTEELGILMGGLSSILAVLIYSVKNIKESSCCGSTCKQVVLDANGKAVKTGSFCQSPPLNYPSDLAPTSIEV